MEDNSQFDSSTVRDRNPDQTQGKIEGKRMQSLRNVMDKTVKSFTNQIRYSSLESCHCPVERIKMHCHCPVENIKIWFT